jgi:hypothetical protein
MIKANRIPKELKSIPQWLIWREEMVPKKDKRTKVPYNPKAKGLVHAKSNDPKTWGTFEQALQSLKEKKLDGIGFVVTKENQIVGFDLDDCVDPKEGTIESWALDIVKMLNSYTEKSPSGEGLRIFVRGSLPPGGRHRGKFEVYDSGRYFTVTGDHLDKTPLSIEPRQKEIDEVFTKYLGTPEDQSLEPNNAARDPQPVTNKAAPNETPTDDEIISRALNSKYEDRFRRLWEGDCSGYQSQSEADLALCNALAYFGAKDASQMDALFRKSKLFRPKWDEKHSADGKTYGQMTIEKAINSQNKGKKQSRVETKLIDLANNVELFHTPLKEKFARIDVGGHLENWFLNSETFKDWLFQKYYKQYGKVPNKMDHEATISVLAAKALYDCPEHETHYRIVQCDQTIFIDLGNENWEAIRITADGWEITTQPAVMFRRSAGMRPLPYPDKKGGFKKLKTLINLPNKAAFRLAVSWLVGALNPTGPFPILIILGPHGSAKSTMARILKMIIDPSVAPLRSLHTDERNMVISAYNCWVLAYDNLSHINQATSDAFCRLSTGGGFSIRQLYKDADEMIFELKRPLMLTSIDLLGGYHDLMDRSIVLNLDPIEDEERMPERELEAKFDAVHPLILGGLCNALSEALKNFHSTQLKRYPRMADFARWVVASEDALPWKKGRFMKSYRRNLAEGVGKSLEADPVAEAVINLMRSYRHGKWRGTAAELLSELEGDPKQKIAGYVPERTVLSRMWPKAPHVLSSRLKRVAPFLEKIRIRVVFKERKANRRDIVIKKIK